MTLYVGQDVCTSGSFTPTQTLSNLAHAILVLFLVPIGLLDLGLLGVWDRAYGRGTGT